MRWLTATLLTLCVSTTTGCDTTDPGDDSSGDAGSAGSSSGAEDESGDVGTENTRDSSDSETSGSESTSNTTDESTGDTGSMYPHEGEECGPDCGGSLCNYMCADDVLYHCGEDAVWSVHEDCAMQGLMCVKMTADNETDPEFAGCQ
jgi:hypothetical protein